MECVDFSHIRINEEKNFIYRRVISQLLHENEKIRKENELLKNELMKKEI